MEINNNTIVNVCNYMPNKIIAPTNSETYVFEACLTDNPIILPMSVGAIKEIHSKSRIFTDGWLTFEDDVKADVYKYLKVKNGEDILNQMQIMRCIVDGTKSDVEKLINIKSKGYFERVYGVYIALKQSNMYDISMRVAKAIEYRYGELQKGIINTQIELSESFKTDDRDETIAQQEQAIQERDDEIKAMRATVDALQKQIETLVSVMQNNVNVDNNGSDNSTEDETTASKTTPAKKGRKPTK